MSNNHLSKKTFDVIIIGAGAVGSSLARELARYRLKLLVLDAADDVGSGATRANSGIVHGGYAAKEGSRKAKFSTAGNVLFDALDAELNFGFKRIGSAVLSFSEADDETLEKLKKNGVANGVSDLEIVDTVEACRLIPRVNPRIRGALMCPGAGIVSPYEYAIALMENALKNGVHLRLNSTVTALSSGSDLIHVEAGGVEYRARRVVNAAGIGSEYIAALAGPPPFQMTPRKGQYIVFRRGSDEGLNTVVFQPPTDKGKGILVTPTVWGNLLVGPDAQETQNPEDTQTDPESLAEVIRTARLSIPDIDTAKAIRVFSGVRPGADEGDFILEWSKPMPGLLHLAGIESPGLTASPAIAIEAVRLLAHSGLSLRANRDFEPRRRAIVRPGALGSVSAAAKAAELEEGNPARIVCRCEQVTEGDILGALDRGIPITSTDAVKRRTRAGMGACQGAFCGSRVRKLVAEAAGLAPEDVAGPSRHRDAILADLKRMREILAAGSGAE